MAAKAFYTSQTTPARPYLDDPERQPSYVRSPGPSPYDEGDRPSPYSYVPPSTSYSGVSSRQNEDIDPFEDNDAIPLSGRKPRHESTQTITPILLPPEDPFIRDVDPQGQTRGVKQRDGWFTGKITWVCYVITVIQIAVFIYELIRMSLLTGTPIEIHPSFNPMIGPSPYVLINVGARYPPCMHYISAIENSTTPISWPCPNATSTTGASVSCSLSQLCGFNGVPEPTSGDANGTIAAPNQWWRFIVPIFLHAGIVHIGFNMLLQMTLGRDVERLIGSIRFAVVYFASGIFGFVLGGNFAAIGIASTGCSGSLFGILAISLIDILYTWDDRPSPWKDIIFVCVDVVIAFVLGLLPGLDNFSHIGGFLMGFALGITILRSPKTVARRTIPEVTYTYASQDKQVHGLSAFAKDPRGFFLHRRAQWWVFLLVRALFLIGALVAFILLFKNFYVWMHHCSWCKYLSCLDIRVGGTNWCDIGNLQFTNQPNSSSSSRRDLWAFEPEHLLALGGAVL